VEIAGSEEAFDLMQLLEIDLLLPDPGGKLRTG
jgi:hypothetical protein